MLAVLAAAFRLRTAPSSWLNLVERWLRELTDKALSPGVCHSVPDLIVAIEDYVDADNNDLEPFIWTATAEDILARSPEDASPSKRLPKLRHTTSSLATSETSARRHV